MILISWHFSKIYGISGGRRTLLIIPSEATLSSSVISNPLGKYLINIGMPSGKCFRVDSRTENWFWKANVMEMLAHERHVTFVDIYEYWFQ